MAPSLLYRRAGDDAFSAHTTAQYETRGTTGVEIAPWLIVVIVIAVLIVTALVVFLVLYLVRRKQRLAQEEVIDPLGRKDVRKRKMSSADRQAAEDAERAIMIRKSLASRTSLSTRNSRMSRTSLYQLEEFDHHQDREPEEQEPMAPPPKDNWKEWEAGIQGRSATPGVEDVGFGVHPALLPHPQLAIPEPSRGPSPIRGI
ncbi:hypothetical protein AAE478_002615 [Parahypoxylon ruwenzoriense]